MNAPFRMDVVPAAPQPPPAQPAKKKSPSVVWLLLGSCFGLGILGWVSSMGYPAVFIGLAALGGSVALFKKVPDWKGTAIAGAVASVLLILMAFSEGSKKAETAKTEAAAAEAEQKIAARRKAKHETLTAKLSELPASATDEQTVALCGQVRSVGAIPDAQHERCGGAWLRQGEALLAASKTTEAVTALQAAEQLLQDNSGATKALATARQVKAREDFKADVPQIAARVEAAKAKAGQKAWEAAEGELDAADASLKKVAGTGVENSNEWTTLSRQVAQQRKRLERPLQKLKAEREAEAALDAARGPKPENSAWDGSVLEVERYLKRVMNDPDSYEHMSSTVPIARGEYWIVRSTFRGKNAFGGKVINTKTFWIQRGRVVRSD